MPGPLAGIRVLEFATGVAGPYCGKLFASLGADVFKVEPAGGDRARYAGPFKDDITNLEGSGLFLHLNTGKRSIVPDAATWDADLDRLLAAADVLLTSAGAHDSLAVLDTVLERYPQLVVVSLTPFGLTGPYADFLGGELVTYALSGYMSLTGAAGREPIKAYGDLVQYQAGAHAALGMLAALRARNQTGKGQLVDVSAMEAGTFMLGGVEQSAHFFGQVAKRAGTRLVGFPPQHSYPSTIRPCADGYVHAHSNNRHLDLLGALIPHPRLADPEVLGAMLGHADEVDAIVDAWLADKKRDEVVELAQPLRLPFTAVRTPGEVVGDPLHRERGSFVEVNHPGFGKLVQPGAAIQFSASPWETKPAPVLGSTSDREAVLAWPWREPASAKGGDPARPLSGIRVLEFTNAVAGPVAGTVLAALGAEVIKVEPPNGRPRRAAGAAPRLDGSDEAPWDRVLLFNCFNHGKRSFVVDAAKPEGRDLFLGLVAKCDVVLQNFAPRVMGNLGLDYEALRAVNEHIVLVSMPAFGLSGPYRDLIAYGPGIDAMSGLSHLTGYPDGPPMKPGNFFCDQNAAIHAAFATMAALRHRDETGEGQHVELAMIEGEFQIMADAYIDFLMNGRERSRMANEDSTMAPHGVFPCKGDDQWVAIAVEDDHQWQQLCAAMESRTLGLDPRFLHARKRFEHRRWAHEIVAAWTESLDKLEVQAKLQALGVPAGAVLDAAELLRNPHVVERHGFEYVETPGVGPTPYPRVAFTMSGTPVRISNPAPRFGDANEYVCRELIGLDAKAVQQLESTGVIAREPRGGGH